MSLAPAERRALDKIEDGLRRSDRRLARMLTQFRLPLARGGLTILIRRSPRHKQLLGWSAFVAVAALVVVALVNGPAPPRTCSTPGGTGIAATTAQASNCQRTGHAASTVENGTAKPGKADVPGSP